MVEGFATMMQPAGSTGRTTCFMRPQHEGCKQDPRRGTQCPPGRKNAAMMLNHEAVILLMSGSDEDLAMDALKLGLTHVKSDLASGTRSSRLSTTSSSQYHQDTGHTHDNQEEGIQPSQGARSAGDRSVVARIVPIPVHQTRPWNQEDGFYLYANAFTFDVSNLDETRCPPLSSMIDTEILSATIIYNLALALTTKAIRTSSPSLLKRSIRLYEMSMGLLNNIIMFQQRTTTLPEERNLPCDFVWNIAIACSNNLGQLAYLQGDYALSQTMRSTLQYFLSAVHESGGLRPSRILFSEMDMRGFKMNIMFMYPPTLAPMA